MAVGDWNLVHSGYELWYPDPESYDEPWVWNATSFYRFNESVVTLAKGPSDSKDHLYLFDQYSISKILDFSSLYSTYNGLRLDGSFIKFGDSLLISGVYFVVEFGISRAVVVVFKIDSDLNIWKTVDSYSGQGVGPHTGPWPGWSPKLGIIRNSVKLIYQVGGALMGGGEVANYIYTSPDGTNWFQELEDDATSSGTIKDSDSSKNFVVPISRYSGLALFAYTVDGTDYGAGYQFANGGWSLINKTFSDTSHYKRLFGARNGVIHNLSTDTDVYITSNITTDARFAADQATLTRETGFAAWSGTWWISGPDGSGDTDVYYWNYPTNDWILDASFPTSAAGVGFALVNVDGTLWGLPIDGSSNGVYYRDRAGFGFAKNGGRSWKLSIDRGEGQVYASTYTQTANPEFWMVSSDLGTVTPIGYSTVSGSPGIVHSHYTNHCVIGGAFTDHLLRYTDDAFTTAASEIGVPSGVSYASTIEQLMDNPYLEGNLFVAVVLTDETGAPMKYTSDGLIYMSGVMHFDARESCRNWDQIFIGQQTTGNASIVQYTENMGSSFEVRDIGLPDLTITDMEWA